MQKLSEKANAVPYLADLLAASCDVFGLPRKVGEKTDSIEFGGTKYELPKSPVPRSPVLCALGCFRLAQILAEPTKKLRKLIGAHP